MEKGIDDVDDDEKEGEKKDEVEILQKEEESKKS